jgi:hypothetical protein
MQLEWNWIQINWMKFKFYWIWMNSIENNLEANQCKRYWKSAWDYGLERIINFEKSEKKPFHSSLLWESSNPKGWLMEPKAPLPKLGPIKHCPWNLSSKLHITNDDQLYYYYCFFMISIIHHYWCECQI